MMLGWSAGIVTLAAAVDAASVPVSVPVPEVLPPVCPLAVTVTVVPEGMFDAAKLTVTGLVVPAGNVMSGFPKEAVGAVGAETPATEVIRKVGAFDSVAA